MGTKRDIYNYDGIKIGELELPNSTTEEQWLEKLAEYSKKPEKIFKEVTPRQIRIALIANGVSLDDVTAAINLLPEPDRTIAKINWEWAVSFERHNPFVDGVGQLLGWTSEQLDALWEMASEL